MAVGQRVLVSGMGGDLGSRVSAMLEKEEWVGELAGLDVDPPRRRLDRAQFHLVAPTEHDRIVDLITTFNPHVVVHIAVWEPYSRAAPDVARQLTDDAAISILGAAAECRALESIIVRSGIEIYGRRRGSPTRPDESASVSPSSVYGEMVAGIEATANAIGTRIGVSVGAVRTASVLGPHVPHPLGRILRMPVVPFSALADPPFAVVEDQEAARAFVAAARRRLAEPVNVVANGAITALQAARHGRRIPLPIVGPEWAITSRLSALFGAPVPTHIVETMHRGRLADNSRMRELLGFAAESTTVEVIDRLYEWPSVVRVPARRQVA
ncbi:MAG: NAD-dependent epimerase/dehydratase family protein [Desertimonas sp.]